MKPSVVIRSSRYLRVIGRRSGGARGTAGTDAAALNPPQRQRRSAPTHRSPSPWPRPSSKPRRSTWRRKDRSAKHAVHQRRRADAVQQRCTRRRQCHDPDARRDSRQSEGAAALHARPKGCTASSPSDRPASTRLPTSRASASSCRAARRPTTTWWRCCARRGCRSRTSRSSVPPATGDGGGAGEG